MIQDLLGKLERGGFLTRLEHVEIVTYMIRQEVRYGDQDEGWRACRTYLNSKGFYPKWP
jgi:hypothetical protein